MRTTEPATAMAAPGADESRSRALSEDMLRAMAEMAIQYDGRSYYFNGYRYDDATDALDYARRVHARQWPEDRVHPTTHHEAIAAPDESDRRLMAMLHISFEAGVFGFEGFRYDRLADAVNYAQLRGGMRSLMPPM